MPVKFDVISDIHLNLHVDVKQPIQDINQSIAHFVKQLVPTKPQKTLVIAGDLGHSNEQNLIFLSHLKLYYKTIIFVLGNHDYQLIDSDKRAKYRSDSKVRATHMRELASRLEGVYLLDGETITIDEVTYGGTSMWYDFSYGQVELGESLENIYSLWNKLTTDGRLIEGFGSFYDLDFFKEQKTKLDAIIDESDVIITHVGPDWSQVPDTYKGNITTSSVYFDGREYFNRIQDKVWVYGHTHARDKYQAYGCTFINSAYGKPRESGERTIEQYKGSNTTGRNKIATYSN